MHQARQGPKQARKAMHSHQYDIIILDEINVAVWFDLITAEDVQELLNERPIPIEFILTGRRAPKAFLDMADLVSDVKEIKHYYNQGVKARTGIER